MPGIDLGGRWGVEAKRFCPMCGAPVEVGTGRWRRVEGVTMGQSVRLAGGAGAFTELASGKRAARVEYVRRAPARAPSRTDVHVPLEEGLVTGGLGLCVGLPLGWKTGGLMGMVMGGYVGAVAGFGVLWLWGVVDRKRALWVVERIVRVDLDGDGSVGKPGQADPPVILKGQGAVRRSGEQVTVTADFPNRRLGMDLMEFVERGAAGRGFGIRDWSGKSAVQMASGTWTSDGLWRRWTGMLKTAEILGTVAGGKTGLLMSRDEAMRSILVGKRGWAG